jgi:preprotein translocase subunit YajC
MGGFFYLFLIRPQRQRSRAQRQLLESVEVGDEVMTVGGMFGTVRAVEDDRVTLEVAPNDEITIAKSAIGRKLVFDDEEYEGDEEEQEEEQEEEEADEPS